MCTDDVNVALMWLRQEDLTYRGAARAALADKLQKDLQGDLTLESKVQGGTGVVTVTRMCLWL